MTSQLDPEEVQAIADAMSEPAAAPPQVAERDFRIPRRLSLEVVKKLEEALRNSIPSFERSLQRVVPTEIQLEVASVREITARGLFDKAVKRRRMTRREADQALERISGGVEYHGLSGADLVVGHANGDILLSGLAGVTLTQAYPHQYPPVRAPSS